MSDERSSAPLWRPLPEWMRALAAQRRGAMLLETAKFDDENFRTLLFLDPICELTAESPEEVERLLAQVDAQVARGRYVAGFFSYECGKAMHNIRSRGRGTDGDVPLIRLGVFAAPVVFDHRDGSLEGANAAALADGARASFDAARITACALEISDGEYAESIRRIQDYLAAGHSYQVNFTDRVSGSFEGPPSALYRQLIERQPVSYAGFMDCGERQILSFSPELFYRISDRTITVRPMKGTWPRGVNREDDERAAALLRHDAKNRAEHVTIVDLLRNDLGKICELGSVRVDRLMQVERYSTVHQMTSSISGVVSQSTAPSDIFRALFPSGSITGAPKRRTMEIIEELERHPRGVYTGSVGWFGPNGDACWNVAIRTLVTSGDTFTLGVGGGITVYSIAAEEYKECKLKASFLQSPANNFHLIETMRAVEGRIPLLEQHLERLRNSAAYFDIPLREHALRLALAESLENSVEGELRVRLTLQQQGRWEIAVSALEQAPWSGRVLLCSQRTNAANVFLHHKTSNRQAYEAAFNRARRDGYDEVIFVNESGCVTEGAISNIFLLLDGALVTPPVHCGVLPGVQRSHILSQTPGSKCREVTLSELLAAEEIWMCNALRGSRALTSVSDEEGNILWRPNAADRL